MDAGPPKILDLPARDLTLFGSATDPENDPLVTAWSLVSGPAPVAFSAPWGLTSTATFTATGAYVIRLSASDGTSTASDTVTVTVNPASSQTAFYVDPTFAVTGNGTPQAPWKSLLDSDADYAAKWARIRKALATRDVIVYFSARQASADTPEQIVPPAGARLFIDRQCRGGTVNCPLPGDTSTHRLTLDGMSRYNTNDAVPHWLSYTGANRFRINCANRCGSMSLGWDDDRQRDRVTIRGFEITGRDARIRWGGSDSYLEHLWVHDVSGTGATVQFNAAVSDYPACQDFGKDRNITIRNNLIERGIGEGLYIAGNYVLTTDGGCPAYGNTHRNILIEGNTIRDPGINGDQGDAVDLKAGLMNVTVRNNVLRDSHPVSGQSDGIAALGVFPPARTNYLIEGNEIFNVGNGMIMGLQNRTVIRNNLVHDVRGTGIYLAGDVGYPNRNVDIYNNTVYTGGVGFGYTRAVRMRNNLVFGATGGFQIDGYNSSGIDSDYNLLAPTGSSFPEGNHSVLRTSIGGIVVNPAAGDFHLRPNSPAIDRGLSLAATGFAVDYAGVARPQGPAWDIGAYEFIG